VGHSPEGIPEIPRNSRAAPLHEYGSRLESATNMPDADPKPCACSKRSRQWVEQISSAAGLMPARRSPGVASVATALRVYVASGIEHDPISAWAKPARHESVGMMASTSAEIGTLSGTSNRRAITIELAEKAPSGTLCRLAAEQ